MLHQLKDSLKCCTETCNRGWEKTKGVKAQTNALISHSIEKRYDAVTAVNWNSWIWRVGPQSQALTGRGSCYDCKVERLAGWLLAGRKDSVVWLWQAGAAAAAAAAAVYGGTDLDIWILFAGSTLRQARLCQGWGWCGEGENLRPFDFYSHGLL